MGRFGDFLKLCRENLGLTQDQVAEKLHIDRSTYTYYETKRIPSSETIIKLSAIYRVPVEEFVKCVAADSDNLQLYDYGRDDKIREREGGESRSEAFYDLPKEEKDLVMLYRLMPEEKQKKLLEMLKNEDK